MTLRRWILLLILVVALFAFYDRQQIFVRDFRANVTRNGIHEDGAQVFFNTQTTFCSKTTTRPCTPRSFSTIFRSARLPS